MLNKFFQSFNKPQENEKTSFDNDLYMLKNGQRLFQLVAMDGSEIYFNISEQLSETKRGSGGFGSTGN